MRIFDSKAKKNKFKIIRLIGSLIFRALNLCMRERRRKKKARIFILESEIKLVRQKLCLNKMKVSALKNTIKTNHNVSLKLERIYFENILSI